MPESDAASRLGVPGTARLARFAVTLRLITVALPSESLAVISNGIGEVVPIAVQSVESIVYAHVVAVG